MMPFGCLASYIKPDIDTPSCAWSVTVPGLVPASTVADNQKANTMITLFSQFSDILGLPSSLRFDHRASDSFASSNALLRYGLSQRLFRWPVLFFHVYENSRAIQSAPLGGKTGTIAVTLMNASFSVRGC
jgi:hypothetical protein